MSGSTCSSFPRRRESRELWAGRNAAARNLVDDDVESLRSNWIPACAGMTVGGDKATGNNEITSNKLRALTCD
ncbi:MAG: hypothetical protein JWP89_799 [Schlesneria sp.]|nr:hypothetical protein [Schlesneria sp.]